jgi:hypothetical protein
MQQLMRVQPHKTGKGINMNALVAAGWSSTRRTRTEEPYMYTSWCEAWQQFRLYMDDLTSPIRPVRALHSTVKLKPILRRMTADRARVVSRCKYFVREARSGVVIAEG